MESHSKRFQSAARLVYSTSSSSKSSVTSQEQPLYSLCGSPRTKQTHTSSHLGLLDLLFNVLPITWFQSITNIICQTFPRWNRSVKDENTDTQVTLKSNNASTSVLYSSDDSDDDDAEDNYTRSIISKGSYCEHREHHTAQSFHLQQHQVIDEYEFPIVCLIDNIIYLFHLYLNNYPAFVLEFTKTIPWKRLPYGHGVNPKKKRPEIINKGIQLLRSWSQKMSRVHGDAHKLWVLKSALISRLVLFIIQLIATNSPEIFKHTNDGFKFQPEETYDKLLDPLVNATLGGYVNWDAHYFLHISVYGYTTENMLAFFPLLPIILYLPSRVLHICLRGVISLSSLVIVLASILNTYLFVKCADNIYELAKYRVNASRQLLTTACMIFSFNPASIFFSGLYTETLFSYLTSSVLLHLMKSDSGAALCLAALSGVCRSNGVLNLGFILAWDVHNLFGKGLTKRKVADFFKSSLLKLVVAVTPFMMFQFYSRSTMELCNGEYDDSSKIPLYCLHKGISRWLPYSYIQKRYWNVGFLQYFQLKQVPNFVLAAPVLYFLTIQSWETFNVSARNLFVNCNIKFIYPCFIGLHGLFLAVFCFFFVHVQVSTRMIMAACPYLYVSLAAAHVNDVEKFRKQDNEFPCRSLVVTLWCLLYYIVGTIAFSLRLPWT